MTETFFAAYLFFVVCVLLKGAFELYKNYKDGSTVGRFLVIGTAHLCLALVPVANAVYTLAFSIDSKFVQNILDKEIGGRKNES